MATLEALIRQRLMTTSEIKERLAAYDGEPAIFLQEAPDDKQDGWGEAQYPRITFLMDTFSHPERDVMGSLSIDIACSETGCPPEDIEPHVRRALAGVFFTPDDGRTFSPKWRETQVFKATVGEQEALIIGMSLSFDVYEFPLMETSDPDPITAINCYAEEWDKQLTVIGKTELPGVYVPTRQNPAAWFHKASSSRDLETCSVVWMNAEIAVHFFAPALRARIEWLEQFSQSLALAGEVTMLDGSPMFIKGIKGNAGADETEGQIKLSVRYGILRKPKYAHTLMRATFR